MTYRKEIKFRWSVVFSGFFISNSRWNPSYSHCEADGSFWLFNFERNL